MFKNWIIHLLGGYTRKDLSDIRNEQNKADVKNKSTFIHLTMDEYWQDLLTIKRKEPKVIKYKLKVWMRWRAEDGDYFERTQEICPKMLFDNKKLIYCLAYITCNYDFKGHGWDDAVFNNNIPDNRDIDDLISTLGHNGFTVYDCDYLCRSCEDLEITFYDENGEPWDIKFDDIHKAWENMTYEEICNQINSIKYYE